MKKVYLADFNNVLLPLKEKFDLVENPRDADVLVLWQDVRLAMKELCHLNKKYMKKPLVVVQHGRAATNDYLAPNNFPLLADKICCWGPKDAERIERAGYKNRAVITGSPIVSYLKKLEDHDGKNIVFVPIITNHEEPENIQAYWKLKQIELKRSSQRLVKHYDKLRYSWHSWEIEPTSATENSIPYHHFNKDWRVLAKICSMHDKRLYMGDVVSTLRINKTHLKDSCELLSFMNCVVGIEEGTFQLLAMAMDIPCVMVDGFKYRNYGGVDYSAVEMIKTNAVRRVSLDDLERTIDGELANPDSLKKEREAVVRDELWDGETDPIENIVNVVKELL